MQTPLLCSFTPGFSFTRGFAVTCIAIPTVPIRNIHILWRLRLALAHNEVVCRIILPADCCVMWRGAAPWGFLPEGATAACKASLVLGQWVLLTDRCVHVTVTRVCVCMPACSHVCRVVDLLCGTAALRMWNGVCATGIPGDVLVHGTATLRTWNGVCAAGVPGNVLLPLSGTSALRAWNGVCPGAVPGASAVHLLGIVYGVVEQPVGAAGAGCGVNSGVTAGGVALSGGGGPSVGQVALDGDHVSSVVSIGVHHVSWIVNRKDGGRWTTSLSCWVGGGRPNG